MLYVSLVCVCGGGGGDRVGGEEVATSGHADESDNP